MKPRGVLHLPSEKRLRVSLHEPGPELRGLIEHHWIVEWDFEGREPHVQENLPHPSVHLVFESDGTRVYGVPTSRFTRELRGRDRAHGVRFRPGGFHALVGEPVSQFTDRVVDAEALLGAELRGVLALERHEAMIERVEALLRPLMSEPDQNIAIVQEIVDRIVADRTITKVEDLLEGIGKRTLQRLFREYVGVSPKWVIQRYRLIEAVDRVAEGEDVDWARLALELGYFDQPHFIRHFRAVIGKSPTEYTAGR